MLTFYLISVTIPYDPQHANNLSRISIKGGNNIHSIFIIKHKLEINNKQAGAELCQAQFELGLDSAIAREPAWSAEAINQLVCTK